MSDTQTAEAPTTNELVEYLGNIPGLGPAKQATLLDRFSSLEELKSTDRKELIAIPGIGGRIAGMLLGEEAPKRKARKAKPKAENGHEVIDIHFEGQELVLRTREGRKRYSLVRPSQLLDFYSEVKSATRSYLDTLEV